MIFKKFNSKSMDLRRQIMAEKLHEVIGESLGEASLCWTETPKGVFDSSRASKVLYQTVAKVLKIVREESDE